MILNSPNKKSELPKTIQLHRKDKNRDSEYRRTIGTEIFETGSDVGAKTDIMNDEHNIIILFN